MTNRSSARPCLPVSVFAAFALAICFAPTAAAQQPSDSERATLNGVVVDSVSGAAIPGAAVILIEQAAPVITDREGRFSFSEVQPGTRTLIVRQLGYDSVRTDVEFRRADDPVIVRMTADPVVLERITVMVNRLERRRRAMGSSVRVLDPLTLRTSSAHSVLDLVRTRVALFPARCPDPMAIVPCAWVRGRVVPVRVFLDGATIMSGIEALAAFPPHELYTLEIIGGGTAIRGYTNWYMETVASGRRIPSDVLF